MPTISRPSPKSSPTYNPLPRVSSASAALITGLVGSILIGIALLKLKGIGAIATLTSGSVFLAGAAGSLLIFMVLSCKKQKSLPPQEQLKSELPPSKIKAKTINTRPSEPGSKPFSQTPTFRLQKTDLNFEEKSPEPWGTFEVTEEEEFFPINADLPPDLFIQPRPALVFSEELQDPNRPHINVACRKFIELINEQLKNNPQQDRVTIKYEKGLTDPLKADPDIQSWRKNPGMFDFLTLITNTLEYLKGRGVIENFKIHPDLLDPRVEITLPPEDPLFSSL